ncbi:MAG: EAL domain-containing protein [Lachnospiraceae bacterium]|nr:EAL domain-containing protein [Lachnospiraceae bacterium]
MHNSYFFYICALINYILCLMLMHGKSFLKRKNVVLLLIVLSSIVSTIASLFSNPDVCDILGLARSSSIPVGFMYLYHLTHCIQPLLLLMYIFHFAGLWSTVGIRNKIILFVPAAVFIVVLLTNPYNHFSFIMDNGIYVRGGGILIEYLLGFIYAFTGAVLLIKYNKTIGKKNILGIVFLVLISGCGIVVQYIFKGIVVELFFESVGLVAILATSENEGDNLDNITGLYNRAAFEEDNIRLTKAIAKYSVVIFRFSNYNHVLTTIGTRQMNTMLLNIGSWLKSNANKRDYIYYINNGEFAISRLKNDGDLEELADDIYESFNNFWQLDEISISLIPEIFVIRVPKDASNLDEIIAIAETDFVKKQEGGFILKGDKLNITKRGFEVEAAIRRGLENKAFQVFYQPIFDSKANTFHSAEALSRYTDPILGFISPEEFINVAEKAGLIPDIGLNVFETVCRDIADGSLPGAGIDFVELNVSPIQCLKRDLDKDFKRIMDKYEIRPDQINIEITESASDMSSELYEKTIRKLRKMGFEFALDDYGTGISNISSLYQLDFSIIKIDKSILWNAKNDESSKLILDSIINMIHGLGINIVMEGVETQEHVDYLKSKGVRYFQGFFYSRPLDKEKFLAFCKSKD